MLIAALVAVLWFDGLMFARWQRKPEEAPCAFLGFYAYLSPQFGNNPMHDVQT